MKAKEILEKAYIELRKRQDSSHEVVDPILIKAMKEYAQIKCMEQREICHDSWTRGKSIYNAPSPELK